MVLRAVLMKSDLVSVNIARQVNAAHSKTTVNAARPKSHFSKIEHLIVKRPIHKNTSFKNSNFNQRVNTVKDKNVNAVRPKAVVNAVKGNNVNAVKASAIPRKNNMYSVNLKDIVPKGGLTCLFAKATSDESKLWHRRLGHLNFKTMNKLVKGNLVRGLPSKLFENDETYIACQNGKQHIASSTKDETSGILKSFITGIENLVDHKVKVIRCDNGIEFKNREMNQFCEMKEGNDNFVVYCDASLQGLGDVSQQPSQVKVQDKAKRQRKEENRPPTGAPTKEYQCSTYLKNMEDEPKSLKNKSFANIQELFDKAMKRVNTFVDYRIDLVEESSKKAEAEIAHESNDGDDVTINATPLSTKSLTIMLKNFDREDLEVLWSIVKARFKKTEPVIYMDNFLLLNLKTMFEHHVEDNVWKNQQGLVKVLNCKLYDSYRVYCVTMQNMLFYLLVEKIYPLTNHTLHQMFNDVKLQVDYECEMAFELL
ncbi:putative ribonuclease H-like domain-containing protein [Tanacetum coccineum]